MSVSFARQSYNPKITFKSNTFKPSVPFLAASYITSSGDNQDAQYSYNSETEEEVINQFFETYASLKRTFSNNNLKQMTLIPLQDNKNNIGINIIRNGNIDKQAMINKIIVDDVFILLFDGNPLRIEVNDNGGNKLFDNLCSLSLLWQKIVSKELINDSTFKELAIKNQFSYGSCTRALNQIDVMLSKAERVI